MSILKTAMQYLAAGLAPLPIKDDGSKQPAVRWLDYQVARPNQGEIAQWFGNGQEGLGVVTGDVSGGLEIIDVDRADLVTPFLESVEQALPGLLEKLPRERTPRDGLHLFYRCPGYIERNQKLARAADKGVMIETRGEGGFVVTSPTTGRYHSTGRPYCMEHGDLLLIPAITSEERDALLAVARSFNELVQPSKPTMTLQDTGNGNRPGDDYNTRATWADILEPHGWRMLRIQGGAEIWQRPGKDGPGGSAIAGGKSPRTGFDALYVYSSNAMPFEPEQGYTKFHAYALLNHNGDYSIAAKTLGQQGYGDPLPPRKTGNSDPLVYDELSEVLGDPVVLNDLASYKSTDMGNGESFVRIFGNGYRLDHMRGKKDKGLWMRWGGQRWEPDELGEVYRSAKLMARARAAAAETIVDKSIRESACKWAHASESRGRIEAMLWAASNMPPVSVSTTMFDQDPWLLSCGNGTLDLRTGALGPGKPSDMITRGTLVEYHANAQAPRFLQFMGEVFNGNENVISFMQRAIGYSLTGDVREQVLFLCWGSGANGKGVLFNTLRDMLGSLADDAAFTTFEDRQRSEASNDLAKLVGTRLVTASETGENRRMDESRVKMMTGDDPITCRFLFNEHFTYMP
ncbi:MAG: phage/plasmid primase, P4 family, partial [Parcubacteria group bacterium]